MNVALIPLLYKEFNFGGLLQFYALQRAVKKLGVDASILKVSAEKNICQRKSWKIFVKKCLLFPFKKYREILLRSYLRANFRERIACTAEFKQKYFLPEVIYAKGITYDAYICGSDQIWNPGWARERAFLTFVPKNRKKIIYAASIGRESLTDFQKRCFKPYIENLDCISVREYSAKNILNSFVEKKVDVVLDPTLLLTIEEWNDLVIDVNYSNYIFTYFLGDFENYKDDIVQFAKRENKKIVNIACASFEKIEKDSFGDIVVNDACPQTFISLIKKASIVFTDSFHASVFSVLFKKNFYVVKRSNSDMHGRIETLFRNFQLDSRIICKIDDEKIQSFDSTIYNQNEELQKKMMIESYNFLADSLGVERLCLN